MTTTRLVSTAAPVTHKVCPCGTGAQDESKWLCAGLKAVLTI